MTLEPTTNMPKVAALFIKPSPGQPMVAPECQHVDLIRGYGVEGDSNADPFSPRQVLITRKEDLDDFNIAPGAFRENLVVASMRSDCLVPGAVVRFGQTAEVRLTFFCEPCKRISHLVPSLQVINRRRGVVGVVLRDGLVALGDEATVSTGQFNPFPESPYQRFLTFVSLIPTGRVVSYRQVTVGMGVAASYVRAIPGYIGRTSPSAYPVHRIVDCEGVLVNRYVPDQATRLSEEGVRVFQEQLSMFSEEAVYSVDLAECGWRGTPLYLY